MSQDDPEAELRALWTRAGVPKARQRALLAAGTRLWPPAPFASEPTEQGNQLVIPGCEKDRSRGPKQGDLF